MLYLQYVNITYYVILTYPFLLCMLLHEASLAEFLYCDEYCDIFNRNVVYSYVKRKCYKADTISVMQCLG